MQTKYIIITGGVLSGLGKGIVAASLAKILQESEFKVSPLKFDGYLNVDAGTMSPFQHGEVFTLDDGTETDMDLGSYERFLGTPLEAWNNLTGGKIFQSIIEKERAGKFLGSDVQFIPHVIKEISDWIMKKDGETDITMIEVGGTIGDIENSYFVEALRQLSLTVGRRENVCWIHLTLVPVLKPVGEQKTKPTQYSVKTLLGLGIQPDLIICRCEEPLLDSTREKIALFCNLDPEQVISGHDIDFVYEFPFLLSEEGVSEQVSQILGLPPKPHPDLSKWKTLVQNLRTPKKELAIGIAGKYTNLGDAYASILKALEHSSANLSVRVNPVLVETTDLEKDRNKLEKTLSELDGVIVPGGFGERGAEGKILVIQIARERNIPFLGLCLGLQMAVVEFARNVSNITDAHSTEIDESTPNPVVVLLPSQRDVYRKGGTMRLGGYEVKISENTLAGEIYGKKIVRERFRHRWEVNPDYVEKLENAGLCFSGTSMTGEVVQILELPSHRFFLGTQFHPEYTSTFEKSHPLFDAFVNACINEKEESSD